MNIIRTKVTELNTIPAVAYKIKLKSGGSGIKMHRTDRNETAFAEMDKRSGAAITEGRVNAELFPDAAFDEAVDLLAGQPYSARGKVKITPSEEKEADEIVTAEDISAETAPAESDMVFSDEFNAMIERYADENGKINYVLMNKQFIQFAAGSRTVSDLAGKKASTEEMLIFIVKNRAAYLAGKKENLDDGQIKALMETIDEIDPRSAFKELNLYLRRKLAR